MSFATPETPTPAVLFASASAPVVVAGSTTTDARKPGIEPPCPARLRPPSRQVWKPRP
jgi:hypothetical protein